MLLFVTLDYKLLILNQNIEIEARLREEHTRPRTRFPTQMDERSGYWGGPYRLISIAFFLNNIAFFLNLVSSEGEN